MSSRSASSVSLQDGAVQASLAEFQDAAARAGPAQQDRQPDRETLTPSLAAAAATGMQTSQAAPNGQTPAAAQPVSIAEDNDRDWGVHSTQLQLLQRTVTSGRVQGQRRGRPSDSRVGLQTLLPSAFGFAQPDSHGVVRANWGARQQARGFIQLSSHLFNIIVVTSCDTSLCKHATSVSAASAPDICLWILTPCYESLCAGRAHA